MSKPFLNEDQVANVLSHMTEDVKALSSLHNAKKNPRYERSVSFNQEEEMLAAGWEKYQELKTKLKFQKPKPTGVEFEDKIWDMFYRLGAKALNRDEHLEIQWGPNSGDHKQIDVLAVDDEAIFVIECKATSKPHTSASFKDVIDGIEHYKEGVKKALKQIYGDKNIKFILATKNYKLGAVDKDRLKDRKIFHLDDKAYKYIDRLINSYKSSVRYQFYGMIFQNELISPQRLHLPALKGKMGGLDYYMLSIEPETLLKIGYVMHRSSISDDPTFTYQRLLNAKRIPQITKFIDGGKFFPNALIINFAQGKKQRVEFTKASSGAEDSESVFGTLSIPNAYGIAHIIDGQHRLYGYAGSKFKHTNTIPVVAFHGMEAREQLQIFVDINENQKTVSKDLRIDLEEKIYWSSPVLSNRMRALRSSTIKKLNDDTDSVLGGLIAIGEETAELSSTSIDRGLSKSSLFPKSDKTRFIADEDVALYDIRIQDANEAMEYSRARVVEFFRACFNYMQQEVDEKLLTYFLLRNRGAFAFIVLIGTINKYLVKSQQVAQLVPIDERMEAMKPYLHALGNYLSNLPIEEENLLRQKMGQGAETIWSRLYQKAVHNTFPDYNPEGLDLWMATQDAGLQDKGRELSEKIFVVLKNGILEKMEELYPYDWDPEIRKLGIVSECYNRANMLHGKDPDFSIATYDWRDALSPDDLRTIVDKFWSKTAENNDLFVPFKDAYSIQLSDSDKFTRKEEKLAWFAEYIKCYNIASDPKKKKFTPSQVATLEYIYESLIPEE